MDAATLIKLISLTIAIIGLLITIFEKWDVIAPRIGTAYKTVRDRLPSVDLKSIRSQLYWHRYCRHCMRSNYILLKA
jgi:hypothetical protein